MKIPSFIHHIAGVLALAAICNTTRAADPAPVKDIRIILHTSKGDIEGTLFASKVPMTAANYLNLAKKGLYDDVTFHGCWVGGAGGVANRGERQDACDVGDE